jgi:protein-disulfide isomerase
MYFAETLNLNIDKFENDCNSSGVTSKIESDFESGIRSGVNGTPTFFINDKRLDSYDATYESLADAVMNAE